MGIRGGMSSADLVYHSTSQMLGANKALFQLVMIIYWGWHFLKSYKSQEKLTDLVYHIMRCAYQEFVKSEGSVRCTCSILDIGI